MSAATPDGTGSLGAYPRAGAIALATGVLVWLAALVTVALNGGRVRPSADSADTMAMWHAWVAPAVGILAISVLGWRCRHRAPAPAPTRGVRIQVLVLTLSGIAFIAVLALAGGTDPTFTVSKVLLLVVVPLIVFGLVRDGRAAAPSTGSSAPTRLWRHGAAAVIVLLWGVAKYCLPLAGEGPASTGERPDPLILATILVVGFIVNALIEELFYRRWLQTRVQALIGTCPAIIWVSILWALWHATIQGTGEPVVDIAAVILNQGVTGLFFGLLWARLRLLWPLLVAHGAMNAVPLLFG